MSGELPFASERRHEINDRLGQLERRLEKAQQARDDYLKFLKESQAEVPEINQQNQIGHRNRSVSAAPSFRGRSTSRPSILRRLETSQYFWNSHDRMPNNNALSLLTTSDHMPSGVALQSDILPMTKRLREIGANLKNMREYRLSIPSDEYFRNVRPQLQSSPTWSSYYGHPQEADLPSLAEIRCRLLNLQFTVEERTRKALTEQNFPRQTTATKPALIDSQLLKTKKSNELVEELKSMVANQIESKVMNSNVQQKTSNPLETSNPTVSFSVQQPKCDEINQSNDLKANIQLPTQSTVEATEAPPIISNTRQIVFRGVEPTNSVAQASNPIEEQKSKSDHSKDNYNRMLDLLRPKSLQISSDSDSDQDVRLNSTAGPVAKTSIAEKEKSLSTIPAPTNTNTVQLSSPPSRIQQPSVQHSSAVLTRPLIANVGKDFDSDSDFFG
ncbi:hypothetical protein M3Y96_00697700 [Aphelenchoides besseyi]|nr:hypothetical protein M3Y96_00697700 [Aphelenchoides besseyi]